MFFRIVSALLVTLSPVVLYFAATRLSVVHAALVVGGFIVFRTAVKALVTRREHLRGLLPLPIVAIACAILGAIVNDARFLLVLPSVFQFAFAGVFFSSLRKGSEMPLVERFARMQETHLTPAKARYCRTVTWVWAAILAVSGIFGLLLAYFASPAVWAIASGIGPYALVVVVFAIEFCVRQIRFREDRRNFAQRALFRLFPNPLPAEATGPNE